MKVTIEIPDELYRQVKAKSALEGRPVREVTEELFRQYVHQRQAQRLEAERGSAEERLLDDEPVPSWFGALAGRARHRKRHDIEALRASIAAGIVRDRGL